MWNANDIANVTSALKGAVDESLDLAATAESELYPLEMLKKREESQRQEYLKQIRTLNNEIVHLESCLSALKQKESKKRSREEFDYTAFMYTATTLFTNCFASNKFCKDSYDSFITEFTNEDNVVKDATYTDHKIRSLAGISGVQFKGSSSYIISVDVENENTIKTVRRYHLTGESVGLPFELQFNVHEEQMTILELHVHLRADVQVELAPFLRSVTKEKSLRSFFNGFSNYAKISKSRGEMFAALKRAYPQHITFPYGRFSNTLRFSGGGVVCFEFSFRWGIDFLADGNGGVKQEMQLFPKFSSEFLQEDQKNLASQIQQQFSNLIETKGLQKALQTLVKLSLSSST